MSTACESLSACSESAGSRKSPAKKREQNPVSWTSPTADSASPTNIRAAACLPGRGAARLKARFSTTSMLSSTVRTFRPIICSMLTDDRTRRDQFGEMHGCLPGRGGGIVGVNFPFVGISSYNKALDLNHFDLLIDWGWFSS